MTVATVPAVLAPLVRYLDGLADRAPLGELSEQLRELPVTLDSVRDYVRFDPTRYTRNLIVGGPWYSVVALCWRSGQRSVIHDHAGSACVFKVLTGVCSETTYRFSPCGQVVPLQTTEFATGEIVSAAETEPHQVSNLQAAGQDLVTLHVYTPPLKSLQTFSLFGDGLLTDWMGDVRRWLPDEEKAVPPPDGPWLAEEPFERVVRFMLAHLNHDMHVIDFARQTGYGEAHFSELFKKRTGESPYHYFKRLRLEKAREMILTGRCKLKQVAQAVGYYNTDAFGEAFHAMFGESPGALMERSRVLSGKSRF